MPLNTNDLTEIKIQKWLNGPYDKTTKDEILKLQKQDPKSLKDAFFKDLSFGTGGMRGVMGVGTNRMNIYTIRKATQGLANYITRQKITKPSVFIGYDVRHNSKIFAEETARVLAKNGIKVYLCVDICPTPLVSFGCRFFKTTAAIMITASHNPPQYNGYKVYWSDGGQIVPPHDEAIIEQVNLAQDSVDVADLNDPRIELVGNKLDIAYLQELSKLQIKNYDPLLKVLYSPLHGTGLRIMKQALHQCGFSSVQLIEQQSTPDGNFPFAESPNPEEKKALSLGFTKLLESNSDLLIATDPDADRVGVACLHKGEVYHFSGNQIACLLIHHICNTLPLHTNTTFVKSIVTSELFSLIAINHNSQCVDVLTGFKYIGEKILLWESDPQHQFLFGAEESCGYLLGTFVRDKDAISSSALICSMASYAKMKGKTLVDYLHDIYREYGVFQDSLINIAFPDSKEGNDNMQRMMQKFRQDPPQKIANLSLIKKEDFLTSLYGLPSSNVIRYWLEDNTKIVIRPSGTEPKMKIYLEVREKNNLDIQKAIHNCAQKLSLLKEDLLQIVKEVTS